MAIEAERGYLIPAVNTTVDYVHCAQELARSLKSWHPDAKVCLLTDRECSDPVFDWVKLLPHGDQAANTTWKLANDWQAFAATPFRQTIKLEADMFVASPVDHWWRLFEQRDVVISQGCKDYYNQPSQARHYRKIFDDNHLPDVYSAITYWRLSTTAQEFFGLVRQIFETWGEFRRLLKYPSDEPTTDVVYAVAAVIMGPERVTLPQGLGPQITHMKRHIIKTQLDDWTQELTWEFTQPGLRINTVAQQGFVHYHQKHWLDERHN